MMRMMGFLMLTRGMLGELAISFQPNVWTSSETVVQLKALMVTIGKKKALAMLIMLLIETY